MDFEEYDDERLVMSTRGELDSEENVLRPKSMADYVGQKKVKENLGVYISSAKMRGEALDHVLLYALRDLERPRSRTSSPTNWACRSN